MAYFIFSLFKLFKSNFGKICLVVLLGIFLLSNSAWAQTRERLGSRRSFSSAVTTQLSSGALQVSEHSMTTATVRQTDTSAMAATGTNANLMNTLNNRIRTRREEGGMAGESLNLNPIGNMANAIKASIQGRIKAGVDSIGTSQQIANPVVAEIAPPVGVTNKPSVQISSGFIAPLPRRSVR